MTTTTMTDAITADDGAPRETPSVKTFKEWLAEGEQLYMNSMSEFRALEKQLEQLEQAMAAKKAEVNQIAEVIGKPPIQMSTQRLSAQLVDASVTPVTAPPSGNVARALSGRGSVSNGGNGAPAPTVGWNAPR